MKHTLLRTSLFILFIIPLSTHGEATTSRATSTSPSSNEEQSLDSHKEGDSTLCQQQAIEARDTDIAASRTTYNTAMTSALTDRKNREKTAIAIADKDGKKTAMKNSVDSYKTLVKKAQNDLTDARKVAWQTFEESIEKCRELQNNQDTKEPSYQPKETKEAPLMRASSKKELKTNDEGEPSFKNVFKALKSLFE